MSRGIGRIQRSALLYLWQRPQGAAEGMPLAELKRSISPDRANARRAIRGLIERGMVEEVASVPEEDAPRRVALTSGANLAFTLAEHLDGTLTEREVPGRPLDLSYDADEDDLTAIVEPDVPTELGIPHGSLETSWISAVTSESAVSDNAPRSSRNRKPHANEETPCQRRESPHVDISDLTRKAVERVLARLETEGERGEREVGAR